jgi:hypothetical protein
VHILPREVFGKSTFAVAMKLAKNFPLWFADSFLVWYTWALMGDTSSYGFRRPAQGPMTLKLKFGKTPVLDVGTFAKVKNGDIKVTTSTHIIPICLISTLFFHYRQLKKLPHSKSEIPTAIHFFRYGSSNGAQMFRLSFAGCTSY